MRIPRCRRGSRVTGPAADGQSGSCPKPPPPPPPPPPAASESRRAQAPSRERPHRLSAEPFTLTLCPREALRTFSLVDAPHTPTSKPCATAERACGPQATGVADSSPSAADALVRMDDGGRLSVCRARGKRSLGMAGRDVASQSQDDRRRHVERRLAFPADQAGLGPSSDREPRRPPDHRRAGVDRGRLGNTDSEHCRSGWMARSCRFGPRRIQRRGFALRGRGRNRLVPAGTGSCAARDGSLVRVGTSFGAAVRTVDASSRWHSLGRAGDLDRKRTAERRKMA